MDDKHRNLIGPALALGLFGLSGAAAAVGNIPDLYDGRWHFQLTPYVWLPALDGSASPTFPGLLGPGDRAPGQVNLDVDIDPDNYLSSLEMGAMLIAEARKGDWSVYTDIFYADFGNQDSRVRSATGPDGYPVTGISHEAKIDVSSFVWTLGGGYTLARGPSGNFDLIAGARYSSMSSDLTLTREGPDGLVSRSRKVSMDSSNLDAIVGARGEILFPGTRWFMPYYLDVGTGSSNWTWQGILGAGYRFDWGDITLALRSISYDFDKDDADFRFTGPGLGVGFRW